MINIYVYTLHIHSIMRYFALLFIVLSLLISIIGVIKHQGAILAARKLYLTTMIIFHVQFLVGMVLYGISPKVHFGNGFMHNPIYRFFTIEHIGLMLIVLILITFGYSSAKKLENGKFHQRILIFYSAAFILLLISIPWPFIHNLGSGWY